MRWGLLIGLAWLVGRGSVGAGEEFPPLSLKERRAARKIYVVKCAKCHRFYEPKDYSKGAWKRWMSSMSDKSNLKSDQALLLKRYLDEYRAGQLVGKPEDKRPKSR